MPAIPFDRTVTVAKLIEYAGAFNEEIRLHGPDHDYVRAQVDLVIDAAGLPMEDDVRTAVYDAIVAESDRFFRNPS